MMTRYRVALDGKELDTVATDIIITDVAYSAPAVQHVTASLAARNGMHVQGETFGTSSVTVSFEIHEQRIGVRQETCRKIQAWAIKGGVLTTNDRPRQRLFVKCDVLPTISSALRWTEKLRVVFTAYEKPFWEDMHITKTTVGASGETAKLYVDGSAIDTPMSVIVTNVGSSQITSIMVCAGDTAMEFENVTLDAGATFEIGYDDRGFLYITAGGESCMANRTPESADDLIIPCGKMTDVGFAADGTATAVFMARGRYV